VPAKGPHAERDESSLEHWRKVFPGVPDDEIVLPRYHAKSFVLPPPPYGTDDPKVWQHLLDVHFYLYTAACASTGDDRGGDKSMHARTRRIAAKRSRQAMRWWRTLKSPTVLQVQQQLFTRKDKWKDIQDYPEFLASLIIVQTWLNLPKSQRGPAQIEARIKPLLQGALKRYESLRPDVLITRANPA